MRRLHLNWLNRFKQRYQKTMTYKLGDICQWALRQSAQNPMSLKALRRQLQSHLAQEKDCDELTNQVIHRLQTLNILNDASVAQSIALQYQPYGDRFIRQQLQRTEFDDITIAATISSLPPEDFRAAEVIKSLKSAHSQPMQTAQSNEHLLKQLIQRGFEASICQKLLNC